MLDFSVTFIITIINITVLFLILRKILFKPVTKFMADRAKKVQDAIEQSEKDKAQAKTLLAGYEAQLKTAKTEAEAIINKAVKQARLESDRIMAESRVSAGEVLASTRRQLEMERQTALAVFRKEAAALVVAAAGRLLEREMENEDNRHYADMLLEEITHNGESLPHAGMGGN